MKQEEAPIAKAKRENGNMHILNWQGKKDVDKKHPIYNRMKLFLKGKMRGGY
jgi:hypothetical protein